MPLELQIIRASEFIRLGAHGLLDLAASREILRQLAGACQRRGINQALLDLRDVHPGPVPMLTADDLAALVKAFCEMEFSDRLRLAVLYCVDPHHRARLFAFMTTLRGWNVKAFDNFEESMLWLSQDETAEGGKEVGRQEIPVQKAKDRRKSGKQKIPVPASGAAEVLPVQTRIPEAPGNGKATAALGRGHSPSTASMSQSPKAGRS